MLTLYFIYIIPIWAISIQNSHAFTTQLKDHAKVKQLRSLPCPNAEDIAPCKCEYKGGVRMNMICDNIANEQELYNVFHSRIPFPQFYELKLDTRSLETLSDDVFGEATFFQVYSLGTKGILNFVAPKAFIKSASTLGRLYLRYNNISSFPFDTLVFYTKLTTLYLSHNPIPSFPIIESKTLAYLNLDHSLIEEVPTNALDGMSVLSSLNLGYTRVSIFPILKSQSLDYLTLDSTGITSIPPGALDGLPNLGSLLISRNPISIFPIIESKSLYRLYIRNTPIDNIPDGAFDGIPKLNALGMRYSKVDSMATGLFKHLRYPRLYIELRSGKLEHLKSLQFDTEKSFIGLIDLKDNQIADVEIDAFKGVQKAKYGPSTIDMRNNRLYTLPESTWGPVIEAGITLKLQGNSLTCGCDVGWLVLEPNYHELVADARCHSGQLLVELEPQIFKLFCNP